MGTKDILDKAYLANRVNSIIEPMIIQLSTLQPEDPVQFMLQWIKKNYGDRTSQNQSQRFELDMLRKEIAKVDKEERKNFSDSSSDDDSDNSGSSDDEAIRKARERRQQKGWKPRASVSAEVYGKWNAKEKFTPIVIEKDEETINKIKLKIKQSFMFQNLNESDIGIIINAMKVMNVKTGDYIINQGEGGKEMYLVETGKYSCTKLHPGKKEPTFTRYYKPGEVFGEL